MQTFVGADSEPHGVLTYCADVAADRGPLQVVAAGVADAGVDALDSGHPRLAAALHLAYLRRLWRAQGGLAPSETVECAKNPHSTAWRSGGRVRGARNRRGRRVQPVHLLVECAPKAGRVRRLMNSLKGVSVGCSEIRRRHCYSRNMGSSPRRRE